MRGGSGRPRRGAALVGVAAVVLGSAGCTEEVARISPGPNSSSPAAATPTTRPTGTTADARVTVLTADVVSRGPLRFRLLVAGRRVDTAPDCRQPVTRAVPSRLDGRTTLTLASRALLRRPGVERVTVYLLPTGDAVLTGGAATGLQVLVRADAFPYENRWFVREVEACVSR